MITISIILVIFCIALLAYLILHSRVPKVKDQYIGWTPVFIMKDGSPLVKIFYIKSRVNDRTIIGNMADMEGEWRAVIPENENNYIIEECVDSYLAYKENLRKR